MHRLVKFAAALALGSGLSTISAHAASIDLFTFNSPQITGPIVVSLAASPAPSSFLSGVSFTLDNISTTFEDTTFTGPVTFFDAGGAGGGGTNFSGPKLFTGPDSAPTFLLGTFTLSGMADLGNGGVEPVTGRLTISQPAATPEPSPLTLTATGALVLWGMLGWRKFAQPSSQINC
jgi:hypothetical protein